MVGSVGTRLTALRARLAVDRSRNIILSKTPLTSPSSLLPPLPLTSPLIDSHGRTHTYLRISIIERCNLRCTYCMPSEGVDLTPRTHLISRVELLKLCHTFVRLGINKIRLSGGEPTLRPDLIDIVHELSTELRPLGLRTISMTSNGVLLGADGGERLKALRAAGLDGLNLSLDTLDSSRFATVSRRSPETWTAARRAIDFALSAGFGVGSPTSTSSPPLKVNTVVLRGENDNEIVSLATTLTRYHPIHLRFIEFMPFAGVDWDQGNRTVKGSEMRETLLQSLPNFHRIKENEGGGTEGHLYRGDTDWIGRIGFISTVSDAFCSTCSRLRLTADGALRVCLHDEVETSLRDILRNNNGRDNELELSHAIRYAVNNKAKTLGGKTLEKRAHDLLVQKSGRGMVKIGG